MEKGTPRLPTPLMNSSYCHWVVSDIYENEEVVHLLSLLDIAIDDALKGGTEFFRYLGISVSWGDPL